MTNLPASIFEKSNVVDHPSRWWPEVRILLKDSGLLRIPAIAQADVGKASTPLSGVRISWLMFGQELALRIPQFSASISACSRASLAARCSLVSMKLVTAR